MTWVLESIDISGVGRAPFVEYVFADDNTSFEAFPPGGHIRVEAVADGGKMSRVVLRNTLTDEVFADIVVRHTAAESCGEEWKDPAMAAGEIGAALYWSMWRMQQVKGST